jgi:hypothetical protein
LPSWQANPRNPAQTEQNAARRDRAASEWWNPSIYDQCMNETPSESKDKSSARPIRVLVWIGLLFVASLCIILFISIFAPAGGAHQMGLVPLSLLLSLGLTLFGWAGLVIIRWLSHWQNLRWFLFVSACLLTLLALVYAEENWRGKRAWQRHREQWEAKGEKFDFTSFIPPSVADDKNFAFAPVFMPALGLTQELAGVVWEDTNALARLRAIDAELSPPRETKTHLILGSLEKGTFADISACADFYRDNTNYPQASATAAPSEVILTALSKFEAQLKELRTAAAERPYSRFPIQYDYEPPWGILLPHLAHIRTLSVLVHVHALAELEAGRPTEAFEDLRLGFRISDSIREEPILIDHLVRLSTLGIPLQTLREGLVRKAWTEAQLKEVEIYLASLNLLKEYKLAMHGERAFSTAGLDYWRRLGSRANPLDFLDGNDYSPWIGVGCMLMPRGWYYQNMVTVSSTHQRLTFPTVDEQARRVFPELSEKAAAEIEHLPARPYTIFAKMLFPAVEKPVQKTARMQSFVDMGQIACAIERFRMVNGNYPRSLGLLVPQFIAAVPNDVVDGKPLRYQLESAGGYVLYSIGWNRTDDGGALVWAKQNKEIDLGKGDWVWRMGKSS